MNYAKLVDNVVVNTVTSDPVLIFGETEGALYVECPDEVLTGWVYDPVLETYSAPPPPAPQEWELEEAYDNRLKARRMAAYYAHFHSTIPGYPTLPASLAAYEAMLDAHMSWPY